MYQFISSPFHSRKVIKYDNSRSSKVGEGRVALFYKQLNIAVSFSALTAAGVRDFFDVVLGNEDYLHHKPSPDAFLTAAYQLGVDPEDCWGFEDA